MPKDFDQDAFDKSAGMLAQAMGESVKQLQALRLGLNLEPFRAIIPNANLPAPITPADTCVILKGCLPLTNNASTFTIQDDSGMALPFTLAANTIPVSLWDFVLYRGLYVVTCNNPVLLWGYIRR